MSSVSTISMLLAAAAGFFVHDYLRHSDKSESHFTFKYQHKNDVKLVKPGQEFACEFKGFASAGESIMGDMNSWAALSGKVLDPDVEVRYTRESEAVALRISDDGKGVFMLTATAVSLGMTEAVSPFQIISDGSDYLIATQDAIPGVMSLMLNKKTLRAIYSHIGIGGPGLLGESHVLECH